MTWSLKRKKKEESSGTASYSGWICHILVLVIAATVSRSNHEL